MSNRQEAEDFLIGLGYFKGSPAAIELNEILDLYAREVTKQTARKCRQIAQQNFLAENQAVSIDRKIALLFKV